MPRWLVILLVVLVVVGSLIVIKIRVSSPEEEEKKTKPIIFPTKPRNKTTITSPTPTPSPKPSQPPTHMPSSGEGSPAPGYVDCEWRGSVAKYHLTITTTTSEGQIIIEQDVEWRKNNEYYVEGTKFVNMTWTKEADYKIIAKGGTMEFHVSERSEELWKGCDVIEWIHYQYGPGGEKIERGNTKPTPGLSFIGFYNLTSNPLIAASEEALTVGNKVYHCWVYKTKTTTGPITIEVTFWFSPDAPVCGLVKATLKETHPGAKTEMTIMLTGAG